MRTTLALFRREYLEHRGAFVYAPAVLLTVFSLAVFGMLASARWQGMTEFVAAFSGPVGPTVGSTLKVYEVTLIYASGLWWLYLAAALFFYFADSFSADRRNNAMLFWKSMPVSDFRVLFTKFLAGLVLFPLILVGFGVVTAGLLYLATVLGAITLPVLSIADPLDVLVTIGRVGLFVLGYLVLALLWYAPFYAWLAMLSTVFRRWSMPLAFLIPGVAVLIENLFLRQSWNWGGYVLDYLKRRLSFGLPSDEITRAAFQPNPFDPLPPLSRLAAGIDWVQMGLGLAVALVFVYLSSEYRRRVLEK